MNTIKQEVKEIKTPRTISLVDQAWEMVEVEAKKQKRSRNNMMEVIVDFFFSHKRAS